MLLQCATSMPSSILIVDDDRTIGHVMKEALLKEGYQVKHVEDADSAYALLQHQSFDLVLLDINLPGISGLKLLELLKQEPKTASLPVIISSIRGDESNKVKGLEIGADDYMVKPTSLKELQARVKALLRRTQRSGQMSNIVESNGIRLDLDRQEAWVEGQRLELTQVEFQILILLIKRQGMLLSYQVLSEVISSGAKDITSQTVYVHINNLRKKLGRKGRLIETVYGMGYKFFPS